MSMWQITPDVILRPDGNGRWVASNPRVRSHLFLNREGFSALLNLAQPASEEDLLKWLADAQGSDATVFAHKETLMANPTGCAASAAEFLHGSDLLKVLKSRWIIHDPATEAYEKYCQVKTTVLDREHLGNFHQHVGFYQLAVLRTRESWRWWHDQKFTPDGLQVKPGLYKWVQEKHFANYFSQLELKGKKILDFACGNGFFSKRFAELGADVLGVDTSPELISLAQKNHPELTFVQPASPDACLEFLESLKPASFDGIYLSDALLFFFYDLKDNRSNDKSAVTRLMGQFHRLLKAEGVFYLMEPNGSFWLSSWFGSAAKPYAVVSEFRNKVYGVAPTVSEVTQVLGKVGFAVQELIHPPICADGASLLDPLTFQYAREFPIWDFYVIRKLGLK